MTTSRPIRVGPSRAQGFLGLLVALLLVFLPLLHAHPAAGDLAGRAHSSCTLCAVFAGMDAPGADPISIGLPPSLPHRVLPVDLPASAPDTTCVDGRAPPAPAA